MKIVEDRYPGEDIQVVHPISSEALFADVSTAAGLVELESPESVAG